MYLIPADIHSKRIIRFTVTSQFTTADDILKDWANISKTASALLAEVNPPPSGAEDPRKLQDDESSETLVVDMTKSWSKTQETHAVSQPCTSLCVPNNHQQQQQQHRHHSHPPPPNSLSNRQAARHQPLAEGVGE
ncbi:hypothetical protein CRUP_010416 [Coryphaenoides rupestris]|nr:hypothetical protein CRUP_010416 [Coryphaenoides rupestris]